MVISAIGSLLCNDRLFYRVAAVAGEVYAAFMPPARLYGYVTTIVYRLPLNPKLWRL
jgi:hypothetical protein